MFINKQFEQDSIISRPTTDCWSVLPLYFTFYLNPNDPQSKIIDNNTILLRYELDDAFNKSIYIWMLGARKPTWAPLR